MGETPDLDHKVLTAVDRLGHAIRLVRQRIATAEGLTPLQVTILEYLDGAETHEVRVGGIAASLNIASPTASASIAALEGKGLVSRHPDAGDRRATMVSLTSAGRRVAATVARSLEPLTASLRHRDLDDRGATLAVLLESIAALHRSGFVSVDESCLTCDHYRPGTQLGYCELLAMDLAPTALRVHCSDHTPVHA